MLRVPAILIMSVVVALTATCSYAVAVESTKIAQGDLLAAGLRIADRFVQENKHERNYRFDLALGALLELSEVTGDARYRDHVLAVIARGNWTPQTTVSYREQSFTCLTFGLYKATGNRDWLPVFLDESLKCRNDKTRSPEGA